MSASASARSVAVSGGNVGPAYAGGSLDFRMTAAAAPFGFGPVLVILGIRPTLDSGKTELIMYMYAHAVLYRAL